MKSIYSQMILRSVLSVSMLLMASTSMAATTTTVNLTAQRMSSVMPDGNNVQMWGYCTTGSCTAAWAPGPTITIPYDATGTNLQINLQNNLPMPTSIVILGQLGGGLGAITRMPGPVHAGQTNTTFPGNGTAGIAFTPPSQSDRVRSFATEVPIGAATPTSLTWNNLKPGTYIYETGTLPSIQAPMGLYGVLIVTQAPVDATATTALVAGNAYPGASTAVTYDTDTVMLFSEVDPVQNRAVDAAAMDNADLTKRFNDPTCSPNAKCYPAAVNYTPAYFMINGQAFDKTHPEKSAFPVAASTAAASGNVLVRMLNAGLRTHIPTVVGLGMSLVAEDGNVAPGIPKIQSEVLLSAGKTFDIVVKPLQVTPAPATGAAFAPATFAVFDRKLNLTTANQPDGGMQGIIQVAGGALNAAVTPTAVNDTFAVPLNTSINGNVRLNDIAVMRAAIVSGNDASKGTLSFNADGSFIYTPAPGVSGVADTFTYQGNDGATNIATVTLNIATLKGPPVAKDDTYNSDVSTLFKVSRPGVLTNDSDPSKFKLEAQLLSSGNCAAVTLNADGSFSAVPGVGASSCTFTYQAKNSQGTLSASAANVTVNFKTGSGIALNVMDAATKVAITDYRWTIQEDHTFKVDPSGTPSMGTRTLGTSFHTSHMPVIATGCVGDISCGVGQSSAVAPKTPTNVGDVYLDPAKHYYISILPGDAGNPTVDGSDGHMMGGVNVAPADILAKATKAINVEPTPLEPAQLSIFIYEDNFPTNGQFDQVEVGLGGFSIILVDAAGRSGDPAGQQTYDAFNMPVTNALLGQPGCPNELNTTSVANTGNNLVGEVYTCPNAPVRVAPVRANFPNTPAYRAALAAYNALVASDATTYALAGHALIKNITPARYDVIAHPGADRSTAGESWWQTETLEGTPAQDAFTGIKEPVYFQEFGPPGFHTTIGYVSPQRVVKYAAGNNLTGTHSITGKITNRHMSHPTDVTLWDSGSYDLLGSTTCQVILNSQGGNGPAIAIAQCAQDGSFTLSNVPAGTFEMTIWDQWLDQIIQSKAVTIPDAQPVVALGNIPVLSWFTQFDQNIFMDANKNGVYDDGEIGIANVNMINRYRDGSISNQTLTDTSGNGLLAELFPLFNWYVSEADTTRFKQTGVNIMVDGGGDVSAATGGNGLWASKYATGESSVRTEIPGAYSYGTQGFISQRNTINWGRTPYDQGENGGIQGVVVYSSTRPVDDQRFNVQTIWEPLVPRVTVNLYSKQKLADGSDTLVLVDTTQTSSWDDFVKAVDPTTGKQINMQCPGQLASDLFVSVTLAAQNPGGPVDVNRCYDGFHNWNQIQAAPYDGRYSFPTANCTGCITNPAPLNPNNPTAKPALMLPAGEYVVETVVPQGYEIVKEEDKNILIGDAFIGPAVQQFGGLSSLFILPDQATLNNANPNNPVVGGVQTNPTSNLGVTASKIGMPDCVGELHRVPDYLSIYPQAQQVAPFAGMDRHLCDRKLVKLGDQMQASASFFIFTPVPLAANGAGIILDDAASEFNAASPDFGEKASVPFVPVSVKDFMGRELSRVYADQWGAYNIMTPSSWLVNPPTPSGYGPNMLVTCMNDPGPIPDPKDPTKMITDPQYNAAYSNFCYTLPFMPGRTTYLDTPVLPIAAFASGFNPVDCSYPGGTPAILRVDSSAGFGPYLPAAGGTLTITALGDQEVPNPGYAGPFATSGPASKRTLTRHYGFGASQGTVKIGDTVLSAANVSWSDTTITATVPAGIATGELSIVAADGTASVDTVTVTIENKAPTRVQGATGGTIQAAIDAATPGDLILVDAGTYNELVIMWKPVRLQGVGATSVIINAAKYPTSKLETWRPRINDLFSVDVATGLSTATPVNPSQIDPLPGQTVTGGVILLEPTVLATEEGAGITVLAKDLPAGQCAGGPISTIGQPIRQSNFRCAASRIDGLSVTGGDSGGGIYVNGWAHNLEIANNRVYGNAGALNGGVRIGIPYLEIPAFPGVAENANGALDGQPNLTNGVIDGWGFDNNVKIHNNAITKNGTVEGPAGSGGAGGGVSICTGTDGYSVDHNWICGNYSSSDGGGIGHIGFSQGGQIVNNNILFNHSFQQTVSTNGGGIAVIGEPGLFGATVSPGTGNLTIDANLIRGNLAETGHGGGIRMQQVNGGDIEYFNNNVARWHKVTVTNNIIDNNVTGWAGGGIALADTLNSSIVNNTVASNDSVGIAGVLLAGTAEGGTQAGTGKPNPAGISTEPTSAQLLAVGNGLSKISSPLLTNNIVWQNRSFYYKVVNGKSVLCPSNDASGACVPLGDQSTTGQCVSGSAYWDLGIVGDASSTTSGLIPPVTVNVTSASRVNANTVQIVIPASTLSNGNTVTLAGFTGGTAAQLAALNGAHTVSAVTTTATTTTFMYSTGAVNFTTVQFAAIGKASVTAVLPAAQGPVLIPQYTVVTAGYAGNNNSNADPRLADLYCNGARVTPEFPDTGYPTGVKNMQVGAAEDEGNNYVSVRYGPLSMFKPTDSSGTAYVKFGDYHLASTATAATSSALDHGTTGISAHDIDNQFRPQGAGWEIGADEKQLPAPFASVSTSAIAFGTQAVNSTSAAQVVTVTNTGDANLIFTSLVLGGTNSNQFARNTTCTTGGTGLAPGASCTVSVTFTPTTTGAKSATLSITDNATGSPQTVTLSGTGAVGTIVFSSATLGTLSGTNTRTLAFGNLSGAQSSVVTLSVSTVAVTFTTDTITNVTGTAFSLGTDNCSGQTIAAGGTCTITVNFNAPTNTSNRTGTLTVNDNATGTPQRLNLTGS